MMIKLNMMKVYEKLKWSFIEKALKAWGFSREFRFLIFNCISSVEYKVLINGNKAGKFKPKRGLRQEDPLSLFLFILSAKILTWLLKGNENLQGIKISRRATAITHLLYADDLMITCKASRGNAKATGLFLSTYCKWSG